MQIEDKSKADERRRCLGMREGKMQMDADAAEARDCVRTIAR